MNLFSVRVYIHACMVSRQLRLVKDLEGIAKAIDKCYSDLATCKASLTLCVDADVHDDESKQPFDFILEFALASLIS